MRPLETEISGEKDSLVQNILIKIMLMKFHPILLFYGEWDGISLTSNIVQPQKKGNFPSIFKGSCLF